MEDVVDDDAIGGGAISPRQALQFQQTLLLESIAAVFVANRPEPKEASEHLFEIFARTIVY